MIQPRARRRRASRRIRPISFQEYTGVHMIVFRILFSLIFLATLPGLLLADDRNKETSDPLFTQYQNAVSEAMSFILYLSKCQKALPFYEHGTASISTLPPSLDFKINYPLTMKAEIVTKADSDKQITLLLSKETITSTWKLYDGWVESNESKKKDKITIPATADQKKANDVLPRIMSSDDCKCE